MRRKELMARALAASLTAVQVGSSVSHVAFAAEGIEVTAEAEEPIELEEPTEESGGITSEEDTNDTSEEGTEDPGESANKGGTTSEEDLNDISEEDIEGSDTPSDEGGIEESGGITSEEDTEESGEEAEVSGDEDSSEVEEDNEEEDFNDTSEEGTEDPGESADEDGIEESGGTTLEEDSNDISEEDIESSDTSVDEGDTISEEDGTESDESTDEESSEAEGDIEESEDTTLKEDSNDASEEVIDESGASANASEDASTKAEEPVNSGTSTSKPMKAPQKAPAAVADMVVITVVDIFVDEDGNELFRETRTEDEVERGTEYSYSALEGSSLTVIGKKGYSGTAAEDTTVEFIYHQEEQIMLAADFTVDFNTNGGSFIESQSVASGGYADDPGTPTKGGYKFLYWSNYQTGGAAVDISSYKIKEDTTFYAYWREAEHTVTFNYNMQGIPDLEVQVEDDRIPDEPQQPTRDGYIFIGWTTNRDFAADENFSSSYCDLKSTKIIKDTTFYAKWSPTITVTITDHFYDLEGNEVAVITRDTVKMCKGAYFSKEMGINYPGWGEGLNPYKGGNSLTGYLSPESYDWSRQYAASDTLSDDYDVSNLVVDSPAEIEYAYEHFKRVTTFVDASGKETTGVETNQQAITNGLHMTSGHDTDHYAYGDETIDYYYREIPVFTYEIVDHYGDMVDGNFVEDHQQSRGTESFRSFYLKRLNQMKVAVNPDGAYKSLAQIKYHGYKSDSPGIVDTLYHPVVIDKDALEAVDETLMGNEVVVSGGFLGDSWNYSEYFVGNTTIDLYYVTTEWGVTVTDEVYGLDGKLISSTPRETEYFTKGNMARIYALNEPGYSVFSIESTSGDALDSVELDYGRAVINSLSQNTGVTFKYTAYPADHTLQIVEVIKNKSRTEKPIVSYEYPEYYVYTPPTGCTFSRLVKGVYKKPSGDEDANLTYEDMTTRGFEVHGHMYVELEFVKEIKLTVKKHVLDSTGKEVGVQTDTVDYTGLILPDATHENLPLVKYSYTYTPVGGTETTTEVTDISNLTGIQVDSDGNVTLDAYYQEVPTKKYNIKVIDEIYGSDQKTLINRVEREVKEVPEGMSYTVSAQTPNGYYNLGEDTITGTADKDSEVVFKYAKYIVLNVEDVYNESDGTLIEKVIRTPVQRKLNEGYSVMAQPEHDGYSYNIIGADKYEGTVSEDASLTFTYRKKVHHKVTIVDKYFEPDGETPIEEVERPVKEYPEGSTPVIKPDPKPGFDPKEDGDKTIPNIGEDTVVIFEYVKRVTVTVVDEYYAEDGSTLVDSSTRPAETYKPGSGYSITPQMVHGGKTYTVINPEVLSGTATSDVTVHIKYCCDEQQKKLFKIAVYDEYYGADGITLKERVLRSNNDYIEGSSQTFSAIAREGYSVFAPASGTIQVDNLGADMEIVFKYKANGGNDKPSGGDDKPETPPSGDDTPATPTKKPSGGGGGGSNDRDPDPVPVTPPVQPDIPPVEPEIPPVEQPVTIPEPGELPPVEPEQLPVKKEFTITVIDKCFNQNGTALLSYDRRLVETVEDGSDYSYSALDLDGFNVRGVSTHEGTIHGNLILEFTYVREAQHTITVVDKYVSTDKIPYTPEHPEDIIASSTYTDTNGGMTYTVLVTIRQTDVLPEGSPYEYHAKEPKGFITSGQKVLRGTVGDDLVLEFTYVIDGVGDLPKEIDKPVDKELVKPQKVLITVVDKYISEKPISDGEDTVTVETIKGEDGRTYVVTGSVRVVEALIDGTGYEYKALDLDGFEVKGSRVVRGKATADKTVEFVYTTIDDGEVPVGVFQHKINYAKKTANDDIKTFIPHAEEPKTGECIPLMSTGFMMLALAFIEYLKKKFRR